MIIALLLLTFLNIIVGVFNFRQNEEQILLRLNMFFYLIETDDFAEEICYIDIRVVIKMVKWRGQIYIHICTG